MTSNTSVVPVAAVPPAVVPTTASPREAAAAGEPGRARPLFAPRPRRLATGPAPAGLIVLVWMLLWAWVTLGVAAPLSRLGGPERARAVQESALRT